MQTTVQDAFALAARHEAGGRPADARAIYEQILAAMPEHPGALLRIAEQEIGTGAIDAAQALLARALQAAAVQSLPAHEIWLAAGRAHLARGEHDAAIAAVVQAMASLPPSAAIAEKLGELARDAGGFDVAEQCFRVVSGHEAARLHALGKAQKMAGTLSAARATLEQCAKLAPDDPGILTTLGAICLELNDAPEARRYFERAINLGARQGELWDNLGLACRAMGDEESAVAAFERALQAAPARRPRWRTWCTRSNICAPGMHSSKASAVSLRRLPIRRPIRAGRRSSRWRCRSRLPSSSRSRAAGRARCCHRRRRQGGRPHG
jgi:tetratricopeptide (TPR) repeat protein